MRRVADFDGQDWQTLYEACVELSKDSCWENRPLATLCACLIPGLAEKMREQPEEPDPLHDALVAVVEAIADREEKPVGQVVEEFFSGWLEGGLQHESA